MKRILKSGNKNEEFLPRKKQTSVSVSVVSDEESQIFVDNSLQITNSSKLLSVFDIPIIKESDSENLCYFYAAFNALPTMSLRSGFSANNLDCPSEFFLKVLRQRPNFD
jgi:hypothetical protein